MQGLRFDDLIERLSGVRLRRRALALTAAALAAAAPLPKRPAAAKPNRKKQRCKKRKGAFLAKGECHCTVSCTTPALTEFHCHGDANCFCSETLAGKGACMLLGRFSGCESSADCPAGQTCIMERDCNGGCGGSCDSSATCGTNCACIRGVCQPTLCAAPCPA
jgi:hypothetical protein